MLNFKFTRTHSIFPSALPVIPILAEEADDDLFLPQINTTYSVRTMDLDACLGWLRKARLHAFRKSRIFSEFRLAKLLSQGAISGDSMDYVLTPLPPEALPPPPPATEEKTAGNAVVAAPPSGAVAMSTKAVERRSVSAHSDASGLRDSVISPSTTWRSTSASPIKGWRKPASAGTSVGGAGGGGNRSHRHRLASATSLTSDEGIDEEEDTEEKMIVEEEETRYDSCIRVCVCTRAHGVCVCVCVCARACMHL